MEAFIGSRWVSDSPLNMPRLANVCMLDAIGIRLSISARHDSVCNNDVDLGYR